MHTIALLIAVAITGCVNSISVGLESNAKKCYFVEGKRDQILTISYVVSGVGEDNVNMDVWEFNNQPKSFSTP